MFKDYMRKLAVAGRYGDSCQQRESQTSHLVTDGKKCSKLSPTNTYSTAQHTAGALIKPKSF